MIWQFAIKNFFPDRAEQYHGIAYNQEQKAWFFYKTPAENAPKEWIAALQPIDALIIGVRSVVSLSQSTNTMAHDINYQEALTSLLMFAAPTCNIAYLYLIILHDHYGRDNPEAWAKIFDCDSKLTISDMNEVSDVTKQALTPYRDRYDMTTDINRRKGIVSRAQQAAMTQSVHSGSSWQNTISSKDVTGLRQAFAPWQINVAGEQWADIQFVELLKQLMPKVINQHNEELRRYSQDRNSQSWRALCVLFTDVAAQIPEQPQWVNHVVKFLEYSPKLFRSAENEIAYDCVRQQALLSQMEKDANDPLVTQVRDFLVNVYAKSDSELSRSWRSCLQKALTDNDMTMVTYLLSRMDITFTKTDKITSTWLFEVIQNIDRTHRHFDSVDTLWGAMAPMPEWAALYRLWHRQTYQGRAAYRSTELSIDSIKIIRAASDLPIQAHLKPAFDWRDEMLKQLQESKEKEAAQANHYERLNKTRAMSATQLATARDVLDPYALCRLANDNLVKLNPPYDIKHRELDWFTWMNELQREALITGAAYCLYGRCLTKNSPLASLIQWPQERVKEEHYLREFENSFKPTQNFAADFAVVKAFVALVRIWDYLKFKSVTDESHQPQRQEDFLRLLLKLNPQTTYTSLKKHIDDSGKKLFNAWHITLFNKTLHKWSQTYQDLRLDLLNVVGSSGIEAMVRAREIFEKNMLAVKTIDVNSLEAKIFRDNVGKVPLPSAPVASSSSSAQNSANGEQAFAAPQMAFSSNSNQES